ncbi:hypothetical protein VIBRN418_08257 [Vibrio sp. N418]|uniref:DUF2971 domain-containing protein n=1 Tax=Vibrio sp. (strain N418) TaxID=701176 RepID=UPI00021BFA15|nr:DUF2971 domain-containing protein [Vibrio sp. N418]EGU37328.1 hypothetical protein VIBRN418_08257 [Vibrio sp. N418]
MLSDYKNMLWQYVSSCHKSQQAEASGYLYHYTSMGGLIGIASSNKLWATASNFLNDHGEIKYGLDLIKSVINQNRNQSFKCELFHALLNKLEAHVVQIENNEADIYDFILCFSENRDTLSQWKGFSDQGNGVAIGFDFRDICFYRCSLARMQLRLRKVIYAIEEQEQIINNEIEHFYGLLKAEWDSEDYESVVEETADVLTGCLYNYALIFKDPAFSEEKEWRITSNDTSTYKPHDPSAPELKFRVDFSGNLVPYLELDFMPEDDFPSREYDQLPVKEIIVGPKLDFNLNKLSINRLNKLAGWKEVEISSSSIPLR